MPETGGDRSRPEQAGALWLITALGAFLRLYRLGAQSFWLDEAHKTFNALKPTSAILAQAVHNVDAPYHLILHFWILTFGRGEAAIRLLSALAGILLIPAIAAAAGQLLGPRARIPAALLAALAPIQIYYSQEAASYALVMLLALGSLWSFARLLAAPSRRSAAAYIVLAGLLNYLLAHGIFVFAVQCGCTGWLLIRRRPPGWTVARIQALVAVLSLPKVAVLLLQVRIDANPWIPTLKWTFPVQTFSAFTVLGWRIPRTSAVQAALWLGLPLAAGLLALGLAAGDRRGLIRLHLVGPLALMIATSLRKPNYVPGRYDVIVFPAFVLALAAGLVRLPWRPARRLAAGLLAAAMLLALPSYYFVYQKSNDREVMGDLARLADRADVLVFTDLVIAPFYYYVGQDAYPHALSLLPYYHQGWLSRESLHPEPAYVARRLGELKARAYPLLDRTNRLFVIRCPTEMDGPLIALLDRDFERQAVFPFVPGANANQVVDIYVYRTRAARADLPGTTAPGIEP